MRFVEAWVWAKAHWVYPTVALVLTLILLGGWYYGHTQYGRGRDLARADIADSISRVYDTRYAAFRDSTRTEIAEFKAGLAIANARADSADARAVRAQVQAAGLTPQVIARTPPEVLSALASVRTALDTAMASNRDLRRELAHSDSLLSRSVIALTLADTTIAQQRETIRLLRITKDTPHGFWHDVMTVGKYAGVGALGVLVGSFIH